MTGRAADEEEPDSGAANNNALRPPNAEVPGGSLAENLDAYGLPKGQALADAIDEIAMRLSISREHAREIAHRALARLRDEINQRGLSSDDMLRPWTES